MPESRANRLVNEKSPYLLKHSHNPVDWWSWGEEALAKAKNDNKPIFLSIGYSTCHWCTVMEKESFEDEKTAAFVNRYFIPIKVDREERPEVDAYYMSAVQAMTGGGGWPLSVFLTPDLKPFYGGTYFPPAPKYGMPSFMQVLEFVSNLWKEKRDDVTANAAEIQKALQAQAGSAPGEVGKEVLDEGYAELVSSLDSAHGGFGSAPKFPLPNSLGFLLRYHFRTGSALALSAVVKTLDHMAAGGIRDHVGGGFHRYSTDRVWLIPHFEKMLYDNALLAKVYAEAFQVTGKMEYERVVRETLRWIAREMQAPEGGFYSAQDADTEEGEGTYYTWTPAEIAAVLGDSDGALFSKAYGVTSTGNFEGRTMLHLDPGATRGEDLLSAIGGWKRALYAVRTGRPRPATDDKILTSWNGLAVSAFAFAGSVLKEPEFITEARRAAEFVLGKMTLKGRLLRRYAGGEAALPGTLEDYAFFLQGLLDLFESDPEPRWMETSIKLADDMVRTFEDHKEGGFFLTESPDPARLKESYDGPTPSGNSLACLALIRLGEMTGRTAYREHAERVLTSFGAEVEKRPSAHTTMLMAADLLLNGSREVVITGANKAAVAPFLERAHRGFVPDKVIVTATRKTYAYLEKLSSLLEGREPGAKATAYVCRDFACKIPATSPETLSSQLSAR